ncbi:MAG: hypothetical protein WED07_03800 [Candidatus Freyarchaeum deiterrae]
MFISKKGKAPKGNYWDKKENTENMTKILFEEVSSLDRRFKILEQQVKTIMQDLYGFRRITPDDSQGKINPIQESTSEAKSKNEDSPFSLLLEKFSQPVSAPSNPSSKNLFSPPLSPPSEKDMDTPLSKRFAFSPSESAHPPNSPTFPSPSQNKEKEEEPVQKETISRMIPRVKLAIKTRTD